MKRVIGIGGVFFKAKDPAALAAWYKRHLGVPVGEDGSAIFPWQGEGMTVWSPFREDTKYFEPSRAPFMINYIVEDLDAVLAALRAEGVEVDERREDYPYGRFGWVMDPEGNRIELWEPKG